MRYFSLTQECGGSNENIPLSVYYLFFFPHRFSICSQANRPQLERVYRGQMRVLTDEPFVPDPGSIFHMQEIIPTMVMMMRIMAICHIYKLLYKPFLPDPGSIFHMQEIIVMMMMRMMTMMMMVILMIPMCHIYTICVAYMRNEEYDDEHGDDDNGKKIP